MKKSRNRTPGEYLKAMTILFIVSLLFIQVKSYGKENVWVRPLQIKFNYETGNSNDALKIKSGFNTDVMIPEWKYNGGNVISGKFAYIKEQVNRKVQVSFDSNCSSVHLLLKLTTTSGMGIGNVCNYFISNYIVNATTPNFITLNLEGNVPNSVGIPSFTWKWEINAIPTDIAIYCAATTSTNTSHTYYTLLSTPQAPMTEPWTSVLDYACNWATNQLTATNVAQKVTEGIYYMGDTDGDIDYDWPNGRCIYSSGTDNRVFDLTKFLIDINSSNSVIVNCSDVGNLFNIFCASVGLISYSKRIWRSTSPYYFLTNSIDPIGTPRWNTATWGYHQYGWYNSSVDDPCLRVNYNSPILSSNMSQGTYDSYLISSGYGYNGTDTGVTSVQ